MGRRLSAGVAIGILGVVAFLPTADAVTDIELTPARRGSKVYRLIERLYPDEERWSCPESTCPAGLEVLYAFADFNDDGRNELIVMFHSNLDCGTAGCGIEIFERWGGRWHLICSTFSWGDIRLLDVREHGYRWFIPARQELHRWGRHHDCWFASFMDGRPWQWDPSFKP